MSATLLPTLEASAQTTSPAKTADPVATFADARPPLPADEIPTSRPSADVYLNDQMPWPKSPGVDVQMKDERGFAADRLFHVPAPGVHPRILFAPEDLPRVRQQLAGTAAGRGMMETIRQNLAKGIDHPGTWENECFQALLNQDVDAFAKVYKTDIGARPPGSGPSPDLQKPASHWGQRDAFLTSLEMRCWCALIDDDTARAKENATALTTYAKLLTPKVEAARSSEGGENFWRGIRPALGSDSEIAFGYDWTASAMTPEQAAVVRHLISLATAGRYTLGMDLPHHWRTWNFIGMSLHEPVLALAIEGEEGYDPRVYARGIEVARDYLTYSITDNGFGKEGIGYQTAGMSHTGVLLLAAANRGTNLFIHPHFQAYFGNYLLWAMQPFGQNWMSEGDLATFPPNVAITMMAKYFFPQDKAIDTVYRNVPTVAEDDYGRGFAGNVWETELVCPTEPNADGTTRPSPAPAALTLYDATRGMMITRTDWTPDATVLHLDCRVDTTFAAHDHADRGQFTLSALGCDWVSTGIRDTETKYHNCVTIDGHGQGFFATPGRWIGVADNADATFGVTDASYCWDWFWIKAVMLEPIDQLKAEKNDAYIEPQRRLFSRWPLSQFERDQSPNVVAYHKGFLAGDPRMWSEDSWVSRAPNYPVERAFRTAGLVRGAHPYVLVVDDIQKDEQERLYEWRAICPMTVNVVNIDTGDVILSNLPQTGVEKLATRVPPEDEAALDKNGAPRLLVRELNVNQPALPTLQPNPTLETIELKKHDDTHQFAGRSNGLVHRLVLPSRSVAPDYKVLMVPYRQGEPLPVTTWNDDRTKVTIQWKDQRDEVTFNKDAAGLTHVSIARDGQPIATAP